MKCGSKKKVKKFAEGGWSTSVSFDPEDAKRRAEQWAKDHPPKAKPASKPAAKPAPKMEEVTVTAPRMESNGPSRRYSAKNTPKRYTPKAFEGVDQLKRAGASVSAALKEGQKPRTTPMKAPETGGGWKWLKGKLSDRGAYAKYAKGGKVRGDGCATKGKTKGRFC